ncbi:MAG TPA: dipeptidase PepE, partial [Flavobacteriaceae bacterium]|nr:dipeptidase PepE [Flavobacteriaceae bacterium]
MKNILIASTSTIHGSGYLEYIIPELELFFKGVEQIVFIPFARPSGITYDEYTMIASKAFATINIKVKGIHEFENPVDAIKYAKGIFTGGGNTFELVNQLYAHDLLAVIKNVVNNGTPYFGTSAGSNICGLTMKTTNDMPVVYPPSFDTLGLVNFNINPHYLDPNPESTHKGETRETRIKEFHIYNTTPVLGLREGSWLLVQEDKITLKGKLTARLFQQNKKPIELPTGFEF